jgi:hypothetical protein
MGAGERIGQIMLQSAASMRTMKLLAALICCTGLAQADPPKIIRVLRNMSWADGRAYGNARAGISVLGATSVSGPSENWFIEMHTTFASVEDLDQRIPLPHSGPTYSDEILPASTTLIAIYRDSLSHRWDEAVKIMQRARYFMLTIYRIRPGTETGFATLMKMRRSHYESVNFDQPAICYQVMSGVMAGTYVFVTPLTSLKIFDDGLAKTPDGPRDPSAAEQKLASEVEVSHEYLLFRIDPQNSYVSDDFAAGDPDFWNRRAK